MKSASVGTNTRDVSQTLAASDIVSQLPPPRLK